MGIETQQSTEERRIEKKSTKILAVESLLNACISDSADLKEKYQEILAEEVGKEKAQRIVKLMEELMEEIREEIPTLST